jgi:hydroxymethylbilane synthase
MQDFIVGSRDSELALTQTHYVIAEIKKHFPKLNFKIEKIKTEGDKILDVALSKIGGKGLFVKEIENALLAGQIDLAVHSMKDVPTLLPAGLTIASVTGREDPRDCLIAGDGKTGLSGLREGAVIGTSSLRRSAQLLHFRPDLKIVPIRGNLNTRLRKLHELELDGIILAYAGVYRLGWSDKVTEIIDYSVCLPAVGQGALGIETRADDTQVNQVVSVLNDAAANACVTAERVLLRRLEGGCQVPIGAYGRLEEGKLVLDGIVASLDGRTVIRDSVTGNPADASVLGQRLAQMLLDRGAGEILIKARQECEVDA